MNSTSWKPIVIALAALLVTVGGLMMMVTGTAHEALLAGGIAMQVSGFALIGIALIPARAAEPARRIPGGSRPE